MPSARSRSPLSHTRGASLIATLGSTEVWSFARLARNLQISQRSVLQQLVHSCAHRFAAIELLPAVMRIPRGPTWWKSVTSAAHRRFLLL